MKLKNKNLLITGGSGFIGSNFISLILEKYSEINVYNLDKLTYASNTENTKYFLKDDRYTFIEGDICDNSLVSEIFSNYKIDGVINFAAETHVDNSITNPDLFIRSNFVGVYNLLNIAFKFWMSSPFEYIEKFSHARFHQISTDEVYGSIKVGSFSEESKYNPSSPYSASKASADLLVKSFHKTYGLNSTISICSNNFGINQHNEKFFPKIIQNLKTNRPILVYGDGLNVRDWIYVEDHCKAVELIFRKSMPGSVYNIGGNYELNNLQLIDIISSAINLNKSDYCINFVDDRFGHDFRYSLDCNKIKKELNWDFETDLNSKIIEISNKLYYE